MLDALLEHARRHGLRDSVARQQFVDELLTLRVAQQRTMTAQCFRQQRTRHRGVMQRGRVELHELDVGDGDARAQRHRDTITGRFRRIGRHGEELARASGGDENVGRPHLGARAVLVQCNDPTTFVALDDEVQREPLLVDRGSGRAHGFHKGPLDLRAGGRPAGVHDPRVAVAALPGQLEPTLVVDVEGGPEGDELVDATGALVDEDPHRVRVAQPGAGGQRVGQVEIGRVGIVAAEDRGDTALRPPCGRLMQLALREHADPHPVML